MASFCAGRDLFRHADALQVDADDLDAGVVGGDRALDEVLGLGADLLPARLEHEVELALPDHLADGALADLAERLLGIAHVEGELDRVGAPVLHGEVDVHERLVLGQHARAVGEAPELGHVDHGAPVDRPRQAHVEPARRRLDVLAEARDHRALGGLVQVEAPEQDPDGDEADRERARGRSRGRRRCPTGRRRSPPPAAAAAAEQPAQPLLQAAQQLVEVGRALVGPALPGILVLAGIVPGHRVLLRSFGDQAAELAASRLNSTKPAPGKQGETAVAKSTPASRHSASSSWCEDSTRRRVLPSGRASSARTSRQLVEPRAQPALRRRQHDGEAHRRLAEDLLQRGAQEVDAGARRGRQPDRRRAVPPARARVRARGRDGRSCCTREAAGSRPRRCSRPGRPPARCAGRAPGRRRRRRAAGGRPRALPSASSGMRPRARAAGRARIRRCRRRRGPACAEARSRRTVGSSVAKSWSAT